MKILTISAQKPDSTGSGVYLASLVRSFARAGHKVGVIAGVGAADACEVPGASWVRPVRFDTPELPFPVVGMSDEMPYPSTRYRDLLPDQVRCFDAAFSAAVAEAIAHFQPDVVLCHHLYMLTAIVRERVQDVPVFAVSHSTDLRQMDMHDLERARIIAGVRALDGVFALHEQQARCIEDVYGVDPARIQVVGTGYDSDVFFRAGGKDGEEDSAPAGFKSDGVSAAKHPFEVVYAGKIAFKKGVESLLEAVDVVDAGPSGMRLRLAGGSGATDEYARICTRADSCGVPIEFLGKLPQTELACVYRSSDVFVLPSFYEGLPLVVVEALACGCAVVVTDLPGIRPWVEASIPCAPIVYVEPPRMVGADEPDPSTLPAFAVRLARALEQARTLPRGTCNTAAVSWDNVAARFVDRMIAGASAVRCD